MADALLQWDAQGFEDKAREAGMCATMCRTKEEWKQTEMAQSIQSWLDENGGCPVKVTRVRQVDAKNKASGLNRPMRVLDLSRVIAAPVAGRTLASGCHSGRLSFVVSSYSRL